MDNTQTLANQGYIVGTPLAQPVMDLVENICLFEGDITFGELDEVPDSDWQCHFVMFSPFSGGMYFKNLRFNILENGDRQHRLDYTQEDVLVMLEFARRNGIPVPSDLKIQI